MALEFTAKPASSSLPPLGDYVGTLVKVEQMEPRPDSFNPGQHQIQVKFVIGVQEVSGIVNEDDEDAAYDIIENDGEAWAYANAAFIRDEDLESYTNGNHSVAIPTFGPRSKLRKWFEAILGRPIETDETISTDAIIGKTVAFSVELNTKGNPTINTIKAYRKPKGRGRRRQEPAEEFEGELVDDEEEDFD